MAITTLAQWMKDTNLGLLKIRSTQLKALDVAIGNYEKMPGQPNLFAISNALNNWDRSRGPDAPVSKRDNDGAIQRLRDALKSAGGTGNQFRNDTFSIQEAVALRFIHLERQKVLQTVFENANVIFIGKKPEKSAVLEKLKSLTANVRKVNNLGSSGSGGSSSSNSGGGNNGIMEQFKQQLVDMAVSFFETALDHAGEIGEWIFKLITEIAARVAPFIGHITDAKDMVKGWIQVGISAKKYYDVGQRGYTIELGSPTHAFRALQDCMADESKQLAIAASISTASFAAKTGAAFADGGAGTGIAIGIVSALAEFARQCYVLASEWKATKALKEILKTGKLDLTSFKTYPLLGAYLLTSATLSDVIPIDNFATPGWMTQTEALKKDFDKVVSAANSLIKASPFEITGLQKRPDMQLTAGTVGSFGKGMVGGLASSIKDAIKG